MRNEAEFSKFVYNNLKSLLKDVELKVEEGKNILTDATCIYEKQQFEVMLGFSETDIAIYADRKFEPISKKNSLIRFYNDTDIHKGVFAIPYVILELKTGKLTTDGIRSRDFVASRIRTMFPFTAYYFIAENTKKEQKTLLRQGKGFTNYFISKEEILEKEFNEIFDDYIQPHISNLKNQLKKL